MPISDPDERRQYYRDRYQTNAQLAINYTSLKCAEDVLAIAASHSNPVERQQAVADYLKEHCKFKRSVIK